MYTILSHGILDLNYIYADHGYQIVNHARVLKGYCIAPTAPVDAKILQITICTIYGPGFLLL